MGYASIKNLYRPEGQTILLFKECYAMEKIHGTSSHIKFHATEKKITFYSGGEKHANFIQLFDEEDLLKRFSEIFVDSDVTVYGEAYGGRCQRMSATYGDKLKFVAFEVALTGKCVCGIIDTCQNQEKMPSAIPNVFKKQKDSVPHVTCENEEKISPNFLKNTTNNEKKEVKSTEKITSKKLERGSVNGILETNTECLSRNTTISAKNKEEFVQFAENQKQPQTATEEYFPLQLITTIQQEKLEDSSVERAMLPSTKQSLTKDGSKKQICICNPRKVWLNVPNAHDVVSKLGLEFVDYVKISTDLEAINAERDKDSTQAIRNGMGEGKMREGVVLRPLIEVTLNNGERVMAKHKRDEFKETKTPREVNPEQAEVLANAQAIADEWVTEMRLQHVLDKLPQDIGMESTVLVIKAMVEDVYREAEGEIVESKEATKAIGSRTAKLFKAKLQSNLK